MPTLAEQVAALGGRIDNLQALLLGARDPGLFYALAGSHCVFGCKVTQGYSAADMALALDGEAAGDSAHLNPDLAASPVRPEEYPNIANIYGEVFLAPNKNKAALEDAALTVATAPATGYHRYDIVYAYVGTTGPAVAIATGTPVANASTPADPSIPHGALALARVHVEEDVTGIADAKITDLRTFAGRLKGETGAAGADGADGKTWYNGSGAPSDAVGVNGDFYLDTVADAYYGPKAAGTWTGTGPTSLIGATGAAGADGVDGKTWYSGGGAPSDATGVNGDFYLDTTADAYYGPKAAGTWTGTGPTSLIGPTGAAGPGWDQWQGAWAAGSYVKNDAVEHGGSSWIANKNTTQEPSVSATDWDLVAAKGADGAGSGDVVGPASSTADHLALFADGTGKLIKDGGAITAAGLALLDDATATDQRATLGLGDSATKNVGTGAGSVAAGDHNHSGIYEPADADLTALAGVASAGMLARTGAGTAAARTITGTPGEIDVANGDAVSGNPTLSLPAAAKAVGKQTIWIPAGAIKPRTTNGPSVGTVELGTNKIMVVSLDFDAATNEYAQFGVRMPKGWNESSVTGYFLWSSAISGTNAVVWGLQAVALSDDDAIDAAFGTAQTVTDAQTAQGDLMQSAETGALTVAGTPAAGDWVVFQVYRDAASGSDTLAGDARLHGVVVIYTTDAANDA